MSGTIKREPADKSYTLTKDKQLSTIQFTDKLCEKE